ncbi:hypothetical protein BUALT_Bualt11G0116900 [Buddleja alternifolia]|uniref:Uncharacterized protein n=1 Tax=Buddleja alternifolia TaxID=168488 RepID=A0AAV6X566_9LAMI|nr:hypothetical protein BUALT_Bualt11G0116900 [Buddleja alternifolia]
MVETTRSNTELRKDVDLLKESCDRTEKIVDAMKMMLANQNMNHNNGGAGNSGEIGGDSYMARGAVNSNSGYQIPTKVSRVEFPHFNGEDLRGWLYKCEQFFEVDETPSAARFGALIYDDPMSELVNLKHHKEVKSGQLFTMEGQQKQEQEHLNKPLEEFQDLFEEPTALPPHRQQDHKIVLKEGTDPISLRPYRYPVRQKDEIEKMSQSQTPSVAPAAMAMVESSSGMLELLLVVKGTFLAPAMVKS